MMGRLLASVSVVDESWGGCSVITLSLSHNLGNDSIAPEGL